MKLLFKPVPILLTLFSLGITAVCASLLYRDDGGNLIVGSYSVWGDWSAHFSFISSIRERGLAWIIHDGNPLFVGMPFQYPFLSHLLTALWSLITFQGTIQGTYTLSLLLLFLLPITLYRFLRAWDLTPFGALSGSIAYLMMGGFQWMDSALKSTEPITNQFDAGSVFTQFVLFELFPQRAFLFGMLSLLFVLMRLMKQKDWNWRKNLFFSLALSFLALLHIHTWMAMGCFLIFWTLFPEKTTLRRKDLLILGLSTVAWSSIFLWFLLLRGQSAEFKLGWDFWMPGWAQHPEAHLATAEGMNPLWFWIYNTGIYLPFSTIAAALAFSKARFRALTLAGVMLFALAWTLKLQPYFYDNLKTFTWSFLFLAPLFGFSLEQIRKIEIKKFKMAGLVLASSLLVFQCVSATIDFQSFANGIQKTSFFTREEMELAHSFKEMRQSPNDLVVINPNRHNHWLPCISGNPVLMGYPGWLWSWGIQYSARERDVNEILLGGPRAHELITQYGLKYAVLSNADQIQNQPVNFNYFDSHFKLLTQKGAWKVYELVDSKSSSTSVR